MRKISLSARVCYLDDLQELNLTEFSPAKGGPAAKAKEHNIHPNPNAAARLLGPTIFKRITFCVVMKDPSANPNTTE